MEFFRTPDLKKLPQSHTILINTQPSDPHQIGYHYIFLCLWHIHQAWQKNTCSKISGILTRAWALQEPGALMYLEESLDPTKIVS